MVTILQQNNNELNTPRPAHLFQAWYNYEPQRGQRDVRKIFFFASIFTHCQVKIYLS